MTQSFLDRVVCCPADKLAHVPDDSVDAWVASIPFEMMRHYSDDPLDLGNYGGREFVDHLVPVIREWRRILKVTGNLMLNFQPQSTGGALSPTEWLLPQAIVAGGLRLVQKVFIVKTNSMPSASTKLLKPSVEYVLHAVRDPERFEVDKDAVRRPSLWAGRDNRRWRYSERGADEGNYFAPALERLNRLPIKDVLRLVCAEDAGTLFVAKTQNQSTVHPGKMSDEVAEWLVKYASPVGGVVGDNFCGSGTTAVAAKRLGRHYVASDLSEKYVEEARGALSEVAFGESLEGAEREANVGRVRAGLGKSCPVCATNFFPKRRWQRFCSDPCRFSHHNAGRGAM